MQRKTYEENLDIYKKKKKTYELIKEQSSIGIYR